MRLLGINIDNKLNFSEHVKIVTVKGGRQVDVLMRLRNLIPEKAKLQLYKTAILPHLAYCSVVWHFIRASDTRKLERIQERALRSIYRDKNSTNNELLSTARLPTLYNQRLQDMAILVYKVKNNLCPHYITDRFKQHDSRYNLRDSDFLLFLVLTVTYSIVQK